MKHKGLLGRPARIVETRIGLRGEVHVYDEIPEEYGPYEDREGFEAIYGLVEAASVARTGRKIVEIHQTEVPESPFRFIFTSRKRGEPFTPFGRVGPSYRPLENSMKEVVHVLGRAFPEEISFRFRDLIVINPGRNK